MLKWNYIKDLDSQIPNLSVTITSPTTKDNPLKSMFSNRTLKEKSATIFPFRLSFGKIYEADAELTETPKGSIMEVYDWLFGGRKY